MKFISDDRIHLFVINPDHLKDHEIDIIKSNLKESAEFREYVNELKNIYSELRFENKSNIIELYPQKSISDNETCLAAEQEKLQAGLKHLGSQVSASKLVVVRVFRDYSTDEYQLHLLSEGETTNTAFGVIEIRELNQFFFADENRIIRTMTNVEFDIYNMNLHMPEGVFELSKSESDDDIKIKSLKSDSKINADIRDNTIRITVTENLDDTEIKVFLANNEILNLERDSDKTFEFEIERDLIFPARLTIIKYQR